MNAPSQFFSQNSKKNTSHCKIVIKIKIFSLFPIKNISNNIIDALIDIC